MLKIAEQYDDLDDEPAVVASLDPAIIAAALKDPAANVDLPDFSGDLPHGVTVFMAPEFSPHWERGAWPDRLTAWADYGVLIEYLELRNDLDHHTDADRQAIFERLLMHEVPYEFDRQTPDFFDALERQEKVLLKHFDQRRTDVTRRVSEVRAQVAYVLRDRGATVYCADQTELSPDVRQARWAPVSDMEGYMMKIHTMPRAHPLVVPQSPHLVEERVFRTVTIAPDMSNQQTLSELATKPGNELRLWKCMYDCIQGCVDAHAGHSEGGRIILRDIKPRNMFDVNGKGMLFDLEYACTDGEPVEGLTGRYTPFHYYPDQKPDSSEGWSEYNHPALDIFALGISIFEILRGAEVRERFEAFAQSLGHNQDHNQDYESSIDVFLSDFSFPRDFSCLLAQMLHPDQNKRPTAQLVANLVERNVDFLDTLSVPQEETDAFYGAISTLRFHGHMTAEEERDLVELYNRIPREALEKVMALYDERWSSRWLHT